MADTGTHSQGCRIPKEYSQQDHSRGVAKGGGLYETNRTKTRFYIKRQSDAALRLNCENYQAIRDKVEALCSVDNAGH